MYRLRDGRGVRAGNGRIKAGSGRIGDGDVPRGLSVGGLERREAPSQSSAVSWLPYAVLRGFLKLTSGETTETVKLPDRSSVPLR